MEPTVSIAEIVGPLANASNSTILGRDTAGRLWVYKPASGERPLWDFRWRSLALREVLTYEIAEAMALDIVPETRLATGPFGEGSAQRFLDEDVGFDPRTLILPSLNDLLWPFAVLDIVTNNADRKLGHLLRETGTEKIWAIDHGLTFHSEPKLRTVLWGFAGQRIPPHLVDASAHLVKRLEDDLRARVETLLGPAEADALARRVEDLITNPVHPEPPEDRPPLPWPVW